MHRIGAAVLLVVLLALLPAGAATAHPERGTAFPSVDSKPPPAGSIPVYRSSGPSVVVCKPESRRLLNKIFKQDRRVLRSRLKTLKRCRFRDIQPAVNAAKTGFRVLIMPGVYEELPSRMVPTGSYQDGSTCGNDYVVTEGFTNSAPPPSGPRSNDPPVRPDRNHQVKCPNAKNLIQVVGDPSPEADPQRPSLPKCVQKCNLQIAGLGKQPEDVLIRGDRKKTDVLRVDRAWGIYLRNFAVEQASFNNIDLVEVNGFRISKVVARYGQDYGILSFTSTNGLYDHVEAYGNGDSGIYPGSTQKGCPTDPNAYGLCGDLQGADPLGGGDRGCKTYSIEIRDSKSYGNVLGYSGTAANSTYVHDNEFSDNATGLSTDSFAAGHPGMPQECVKWENNRIHSNNANFFTEANQKNCAATPFVLRPKEQVCPQFQVPVGTGILIAGGNRNIIQKNHLFDNYRVGILLIGVPASLRGDNDPAHQQDTSNGNRFLGNVMGADPSGARRPNGQEFVWDSQGAGNCFEGNQMKSGAGHGSEPKALPACPGSPVQQPTNLAVIGPMLSCAAWDPMNMTNPPGCTWFTTPPKPE